MSIVVQSPDLLHCYRKGAYRELLSSVEAKSRYEIQDVLVVGLAYRKLNQLDKSRKCMDFVIERVQEQNLLNKHARFIRSQLSIATGDWETAISHLEELWCMEYPHEAAVTNSLAYAYWKNQNAAQAVFTLEYVLRNDNQNAAALNSLGFILADTDSDLPKARSLCERALRLKTDHGPYLDSFGWDLYKLGQRAKAVYALRKAMILNPEDKEVHYHLRCATAC